MLKPLFLIILFPFFLCGCIDYIGNPPNERITEPANKIISSLDKYQKAHGKYPDSLAELVPEYLESIPIPQWGVRSWSYERSESGSSFFMSVKRWASSYEMYYYDHDYKRWGFDG
jgi:hypothetical protein